MQRSLHFFILVLTNLALAQQPLTGTKQSCEVEGQPIVLTDAPHLQCFDCTCHRGEVQCLRRKCPDVDGCHLLETSSRRDECCPTRCKGCSRNGSYYNSGAVWTESKHPCKRFTCAAGVITESTVQCYTPCDDPAPPRVGQCCPTCSGYCGNNNSSVFADAATRSNPCISCDCQSGLLTCTKRACPVLNCPKSSVVYDFEQCCPRCQGSGKMTAPPRGACLLGSVVYPAGKRFTLDECTECSCDNSTLTCERTNCPVLKCQRDKQKIGSGQCCASCIDDDEDGEIESGDEQEFERGCAHSNKTYEDGETWNTTDCQTCVCKHGRVECSPIMCPAVNCPENSTLRVTKGNCCPECVENHGVCTIFGGSHFRSFDDRLYAFVGSCKYQLVSDCAAGRFNVRVKFLTAGNDATLKRLFAKVSNARLDIQQNGIVRVNERAVGLPYRLADKLDIGRTRDSVIVDTAVGLRIKWNYEGFLEVALPRTYGGNVCGLCGNFNSLPDDDLTTREGILVESPAVFAQSWTVGDEECFDTREYEVRACNARRDQRLCNYMKGAVFRRCLQRINVTSYYEACLKDMCQCEASDLQCHCEAFDSYVQDCRKLGITLPRWRKAVGC